jgi:hypothetical protein
MFVTALLEKRDFQVFPHKTKQCPAHHLTNIDTRLSFSSLQYAQLSREIKASLVTIGVRVTPFQSSASHDVRNAVLLPSPKRTVA